MATDIGKMALQLTANAAPMLNQLNQAQKGLDQAGGKMSGAVGKIAKETAEKSKEGGGLIGAAIVGGIAGAITGGIASVGGMLLGSVGGLYKTFVGLFKGVVEAGEKADEFNLSIGQMRSLMLAGGTAGERMTQVIGSMEDRFHGLAVGSLDSVRAFERIKALSGGALDVGKLVGGDRVDRYAVVFDALAKIEDRGQRASAAFALLGDGARSVMHLVNQGGDAFRAAADAGQRFGLNAGDGIVAAARAALNFNENLKAMKDGVLNQLVVFIAPVVERIAEAFKTGGISFDGLAQKIFEYSKVIVEWAALVADAWNKPGKSWELLELGMEALSLAIKKGVQEGLAEFQKLFDVGEKVRGMGTVGKALSASLFGPAGVALNNMFGGDDPAAKAKEHAEALEKLKEKFQGIGKAMADMPGGTPIRDRLMKEFDEIEKRMKQFRDRAGDAGDAMGNRIREQIQKQFDAMNQANRTPMEMFREQMLSIQQQAAQGLFAGQKGLMERFQGKAFMELASATQLPEYRMAGAALSTSREAYSAIATQASGMQRQNVQDQMKAIMEEQKRLQEEQVRVGKEAAEAIKALNAKLEVK